MSDDPRTPDDDTIDTGDAPEHDVLELPDAPYHGPDPEADEKGDGSDEDQGT